MIVVWKRHSDCIISMKKILKKSDIKLNSKMQWFYTSKFRFVDRKKWMKIAIKANQMLNEDYKQDWEEDILFSEDIF